MAEQPGIVAITGATGTLGRHVCTALAGNGYALRALVRDTTKAQSFLPAGIALIEGDLSGQAALDALMAGADTCIHMAALVRFDRAARKRLLATNYLGTKSVVNGCLHHGIRHLVQIGSVAALPISASDARTIATAAQHTSYYGFTKRLANLEVERAAAEGLGFTILNPSVILAAGDNQSSGAIAHLALKKRAIAPAGYVHWVAASDMVGGVLQALEYGPQNQSYVLDAGAIAWADLYAMIRKVAGQSGSFYTVPSAAVPLLARLAAIVAPFIATPLPEPKQLLAMLTNRPYPGADQGVELLAHPYTNLETAVASMVGKRFP